MTRAAMVGVAAAAAIGTLACLAALAPGQASASLPCKVAGAENGLLGKACNLAQSPGKVVSAGKNLLTGHFGSALKDIFGGASSTASTKLAIAAVVLWVAGGAKFALDETAKILSRTTRPNLRSTWFSGAYWRMAGIAALLTLPFLFAAAVQALLRSDLGLLTHAALGYLPLAMLAVSIAAPVATLLLAATDQLSGLVSSDEGARFLSGAGNVFGVAHFVTQPFVVFLLGAITAGGALTVWIELALREAAVYVIVLMLPLAFAALVWPARRVWARRSVELLVALILSKFAIVAVLGLAGAALDQGSHGGLTTALAGTVLVLLAAFAPWALLRLLPMSELAAGAVATLRPEVDQALHRGGREGDKAASERPPLRRDELRAMTEDWARDAARNEVDGLEEHAAVVASPVRGEGVGAEPRPERQPAEGGRTEPAPADRAPNASDGRPAVLEPVGAAISSENETAQNRPEPPAVPLGLSAFNDEGKWAGPVNDLTTGAPGEDHNPAAGEDHNPLPPSEDEDPL